MLSSAIVLIIFRPSASPVAYASHSISMCSRDSSDEIVKPFVG